MPDDNRFSEPYDFEGSALEYPLSYGQARLWFLDKLLPGNAFYNLPLAVRLPRGLNRQAFGLALNEIVRRHESLRCCVREQGGEPVSIVLPFQPFALRMTDLSGLSRAEHAARLTEIPAREAGQPFDLAKAPLARFHLLKLAGGEYLFMATMHHIISDGWSMGVFWRELTALYADAAAGRRPQLAEPELQFGDYAVWQREQCADAALDAQQSYWHDRLRGIEQLDLQPDFPRPEVQKHNGATHGFTLATPLTGAITELAQRHGTTPFAVLLAGLAILMGRYAGQSDVVLGAPVANRDREELESLIGFFVNSLVLRIDLSGAPDFGTVLDRAARTLRDALSHSDYPFERLVDDLDLPRDRSRNPVFQISAQLFAVPGQRQQSGATGSGAQGGVVVVDKGTALFDMSWNFWFEGAQIRGQVEFDTDLFDPRRIASMAAAFTSLMSAAAEHPDCPAHRLPLLSGSTRQELSERALAQGSPDLWTRIRASASARAGETVLEYGDTKLSGAELVSRVEGIAAGLQAQGVGPEDLVALDMPRSGALVLSCLAVLAAGGAFMPLNPDDPPARKAEILAKTGCRLTVGTVAGDGQITPEILARAAGSFRPVPPPETTRLAYVIQTSGSTGTPKAVAQSHGAIAAQIDWLTRRLDPQPDDAILLKTPLVFDASLWELFLPLAAGFRLVVGDPDIHRDPRQIVRSIAVHGVTMVQLVPSVLRLVIEDLHIAECHRLRLVAVGGEPLDHVLLATTRDTLPACRIANLYGPAETCVQSAVTLIEPGDPPASPALTERAGGHRLYLLGPELEALPPGHPGELWVGGIGVARGYLGQTGLTAAQFLPDPFAADGSRMYRTGDRFIRTPDGRLGYLGRADAQIKRAGIRIEPGEIEAAALCHPEISRAALLMRNGSLVLYAETGCPAAELRRHLQSLLPKQMLPETIVPMAAFPVLISGKTDRQALAALDHVPAPAADRPPRSRVDEAVATIWAEMLDLDTVQIDQDFFAELGGHSLLAIRAVVSMRDLLGVELPLHLIFDHSSVAALVDALAQIGANAARLAEIEDALSA